MEQFVDLVNTVSIRTEAIFRSGLPGSREKSSGGGYQSTTGEFVKSLQDMASCGVLSTMCGSVILIWNVMRLTSFGQRLTV